MIIKFILCSGSPSWAVAHYKLSLIVLLDARDPRDRFTSFREIHISVMLAPPRDEGPAAHLALRDMRLSKSSTLTKMFLRGRDPIALK